MILDIDVRTGSVEHHPFIYATWLHNYKHCSYFAKRITNTVFFANHHKVLEKVIEDPETKILIAQPKDDSEVVLGFIVYNHKISEQYRTSKVVHYVYVKKSFRGFGIAKRLCEEAKINPEETQFTHWSFDANWITERFNQLVYNPYI